MSDLLKDLPNRCRQRFSLLVLLAIPTVVSAAPPDSSVVQVIRSGVVHRAIVRSEGPWRIHVLEIDVRRPELSIRSARAFDRLRGREQTSVIASRFPDSLGHVVAALNADFFSLETGESVNTQVMEGAFIKAVGGEKPFPRSQFGMTWGRKPFIERTVYTGMVFMPNAAPALLGGINVLPDSGEMTLLNRFFHEPLPDSSGNRPLWKLPLHESGSREDTMFFMVGLSRKGEAAGEATLLGCTGPPDGLGPHYADGEIVKVLHAVRPSVGRVRTLVGGAPRIVLDGKSLAGQTEYMEETFPGFSSKRHPRTGIGFSRDSTKIFLLVVDGRQTGSVGMSLPEFADLMIEQGVWQGLNLDGGGSTVMVVEGKVVNSPSDAAGERPVANCLLLVAEPAEKKAD